MVMDNSFSIKCLPSSMVQMCNTSMPVRTSKVHGVGHFDSVWCRLFVGFPGGVRNFFMQREFVPFIRVGMFIANY